MLRIKICGLTTPEDALAAIESGADALGFNFYPGSKRYLQMQEAGWIAGLPEHVLKVAIVVNPGLEEARAAAALPGITSLQLHGAETPEFCRRLTEEGIRFEKALPVTDVDSLADVPNYFTNTILLDSAIGGDFGGSGQTFPWETARDYVRANPHLRVILAGGLKPENVAEAVRLVRPFGVDVTSGVEFTPGRKDYARVRSFIAAARAA